MPRIYGKGEKPHDVFSKYAGTNKQNRYFYLRIGRVLVVDYERYRMKIEWVTGAGTPAWIPLSYPYVGPAGCIGATPEVGSLGIFGYLDEGYETARPICIAFVPIGLQTAIDYNAAKLTPDSIPTEEQRVVYHRFRPLNKGDVIVTSSLGAEIFLNTNIELKDSMNDNITIRPSDQAIIATSLNNFVFVDGAAVYAGPIIRNKVNIYDENGYRIPDLLAREINLPDGREAVYLTPKGERVEENSQFYTEYRISAGEIGDGILDTNDINSQSVLSTQTPLVTMAMGNYCGADELDTNYGKILRPVLFNSGSDSEGQFNLIECTQNKGVDEVTALGLAYVVHVLGRNSLFGFDKEGHCYLNLNGSTSANPLGPGRSMSILANGNLKEIWGTTAENNNSWDLTTKGGIKWNIGAHNSKVKERSIDIKTTSGIKIEVRNNAEEGNAKEELLFGNVKTNVGGNEYTEISGNQDLIVNGLQREQIRGSASHEYHSDKTENVLGVYTQTVIKEMQGKFGKRKETVLLGQELEVMTGNIKETIKTFGNKSTTLTLGNIEEKIIAGNRKCSILLGKYTVDIKAGNIEIKTLAGQAKLSAIAGVTIESVAKADVKALQVKLGMGPHGGVVTGLPGLPSHFDYMTGAPVKGTFTIKAGA
jgi:hypothetical protein